MCRFFFCGTTRVSTNMHTFLMGSIIALSIFYASVMMLHFMHRLAYMFRKIVHATAQLTGVAIVYSTALPALNDSRFEIRHGARVVCIGIMPTVLLSRIPPLKRWHVSVGKAALLTHALLLFVISFRDSIVTVLLSGTLVALFTTYILTSSMRGHPAVSKIIARNADGSYTSTRTHGTATVVGGGWASYLNRTVTAREVSSRVISGEYARNVWGAGTSIATVQRVLRKRKQTLPSHPCIMGATLGGWVFTSAHGSGGSESPPAIKSFTVYDIKRNTVGKREYPCAVWHGKSLEELRRYIILEVEIIPCDNICCHLRVASVNNERHVHCFMHAPSVNRMIFLDRSATLSLVWTRTSSVRTYGLGTLVPIWLTSVGPRFFARIRTTDWSHRASLSEANHFAPDPPYYSGLIARCFTNFECFVRPVPSSSSMWRFMARLQELFAAEYPSARCEVRVETSTLFLDFSVLGAPHFDSIFKLIDESLHPRELLLHQGKYVPRRSPACRLGAVLSSA